MLRLISGSFLLAALVSLATAADKEQPGGGNVYKKSLKSVTWIVTPFEDAGGGRFRYGTGTGSLIDKTDRLVITNYHVVREYETVSVLFPVFENGNAVSERDRYLAQVKGGTAAKGKVIAKDPKKDLALIRLDKLPGDAPILKLGKDGVGPGDNIHCIGNAGVSGGLWAYTPGNVKNVINKQFRTGSRTEGGKDSFTIDARLIENTAPTNEGDSGGPVLNGAGELIGVTQGYMGGEAARGISYAIDLSEVKAFLKAHKYGRLLNASGGPAVAAAPETPTETPVTTSAPATDPKADAAKAAQTAATKLGFAKDLINAGKKERAKERLEEIIKNYADTPAATEAKQLLETLK